MVAATQHRIFRFCPIIEIAYRRHRHQKLRFRPRASSLRFRFIASSNFVIMLFSAFDLSPNKANDTWLQVL